MKGATMRKYLLVVVFVCVGCASDNPDMDKLQPGTMAVAVLGEDRPKGEFSSDKVALWKDGYINPLTNYVGLAPGVRVTVGDDPGYYDRTKEEIDKDLKDAIDRKDSEYSIESYKSEKPEKY